MESLSSSAFATARAKVSPLLKSSTQAKDEVDNESQDRTTSESSSADFAAFMETALGGATKTQVSEEELFSALIEQRLNSKDSSLAEAYRKSREELSLSLQKTDGFIPAEEVALRALEQIYQSGSISQEDAELISGEAFLAAQLDDDLTTLFDNRGGPGDATIAVAATNEAISKAQLSLENLTKDTSTVTPRSITSAATGIPGQISSSAAENIASSMDSASSVNSNAQKLDGAGGFLWKPVSESDGKLAVLLPEEYAGDISKVEVYSKLPADSSSLVDTSRYGGSHEGRPIFRFHKSGADMGDNVYLVVTKDDGTTAWWEIADGSKRTD